MSATVNIEALSPCEMVLYLSEVSLKDSKPDQYGYRNDVTGSEQYSAALVKKALRFSLVNGQVAELCPDQEEEAWVLNIKRGILSGFQNTMEDYKKAVTKRETDVIGNCDVTYTPIGSTWSNYKVTKEKDVLSCTGHQSISNMFQSTPYNVPSKIQSLPILKSTHECEQEVTSTGRLVKVTCTEHHSMRPFAKEGSSATTEVTYTMTFLKESTGVSSSKTAVSKRVSLEFDNTPTDEEEATNKVNAIQTLRQICEETTIGVRPETPSNFKKLIKEMRKLNSESLNSIYRSIQSEKFCNIAKKFFQDALPTVGTSASVSMMSYLIKNEEVTDMEADLWLTSLAFISKPTKEMLVEVESLLSQSTRKSSLAAASLVHAYCRDNDCSESREVANFIAMLGNKIGND
jgi:hypothetical protein